MNVVLSDGDELVIDCEKKTFVVIKKKASDGVSIFKKLFAWIPLKMS